MATLDNCQSKPEGQTCNFEVFRSCKYFAMSRAELLKLIAGAG
jgi:hypothetical protein